MTKVAKAARDLARGYSDEDLAEISEDLDLTPEQVSQAKSFGEAFPDLHAAWEAKRTRGKQKSPTKISVAMRLSRDVVEHYRAGGKNWTVRVDEILRKAAGL